MYGPGHYAGEQGHVPLRRGSLLHSYEQWPVKSILLCEKGGALTTWPPITATIFSWTDLAD
ncbi:hypothetical protein T11_7769 [Trichinella zimbabwensis]|uniref:Uncharacterized protein n=1 Tax=Trichinella zimbabwensis TaxID=268475 RepID=A0A0V1HUP1_9BILA|nr:hypothetical protein T11_5051 [Trichinella zimbabwensis]KRZ13317.1 hypothetical protein T11_7769 [Trichinella zimbabwensis]